MAVTGLVLIGDLNKTPIWTMKITPSKILAIFMVGALVLGAYYYGVSGSDQSRWSQLRSAGSFQDYVNGASSNEGASPWLSSRYGRRRPPPIQNEEAPVFDLSNQQMSFNAFVHPTNSTEPVQSLQDQRNAFLDTIKHLETIDDMDNPISERANGSVTNQDSTRDPYLSDTIEVLMEKHGIKQYLYFHGEQKWLPYTPTYFKIPPVTPTEAYVITVDKLPNARYMPTMGNGHIGTVVDSPTILMNGLYNGAGSVSHRARIPSMVAFAIRSIQPSQPYRHSYTLNFADGTFKESFRGEDFVIDKTTYVHRLMERIVVCEVDILRLRAKSGPQRPMKINMELKGGSSQDITFSEGKCSLANCVYIQGKINDAETPKSPKLEVHIYYNPLINGIDVPAPKGENGVRHKYYFYAAISPSAKDAYTAFKEARATIERNELLSTHVSAWRSIWQHGAITLDGNPDMQKAITGSMFYIYSSMPMRNDTIAPFVGLSPTDLGHGTSLDDYRGHVFWDQEVWVMPTLLLFRPYMAQLILASRARTVEAAYTIAEKNNWRGTQFPWESAYTGLEVTPGEIYARYEQHVTGDIALAMQLYVFATKDKSLFDDIRYKKVLNGAATFWDSRLERDKGKDKYVIKSVMPPDESHYNVNNSAYTNLIAKISMQAPYRVFSYLGLPAEAFKSVYDKAEEIYQPFDRANLYHPEYDGYKIGTKVKQADVVMMPYPLNEDITSVVKRRDLTVYEKVTEKEGPAMTYSMFAIGYCSLRDYENAHRMINKTQMHVRPPFQVWSELRNGNGAVNFITGAGGYLQGILNGYGGIRIKQHYLELNPSLPAFVTAMNITGIKYQGGAFIVSIREATMTIIQIRTTTTVVPFKVRVSATKKDYELIPAKRLTIPRQQIAIMQVYGVGETVHDTAKEVNPRKPSGKGIVEPPRASEKKKPEAPSHASIWAIKPPAFSLPVSDDVAVKYPFKPPPVKSLLVNGQVDLKLKPEPELIMKAPAPPKPQFTMESEAKPPNEPWKPAKPVAKVVIKPPQVTKPAPKATTKPPKPPVPKPAAQPTNKPATAPVSKPVVKPATVPAAVPAAVPVVAKPAALSPMERARQARLSALSRIAGGNPRQMR